MDTKIITGAMPLTPPHALKPWDTYAVNGVQLSAVGTSVAFSAKAVVGESVLRDAGTVQGPPRVPR